jgi:isocitrate dehydrogenase
LTETVTIPYIQGDGSAEDIWKASREILEEAVVKGSDGRKRRIEWIPLLAGQKALERTGALLPEETVNEVRRCGVAIKGPLTTPVGGGFRSVNVHLRQVFDLYVCMRPVRYFTGLPSPLKRPEGIDLIIFRENTEDLYKGIEWKEGSERAHRVIRFLKEEMNVVLPGDTGVGIKPISKNGTTRFTNWVLQYAVKHGRKSVTVVHKGNIMKYTEGAFREWAYDAAREFGDAISLHAEKGKVSVNDRIADNMFMQVILRPDEYDVLLCPNLNGDYLSDACAALIGGLGVAPGANIGDEVAIFEPTHGSALKYAGKDMINPTSFILSGAMMFRHMGLEKAAALVDAAVEETIQNGIMTYDLARLTEGVTPVKCSRFGKEVAERIRKG